MVAGAGVPALRLAVYPEVTQLRAHQLMREHHTADNWLRVY